MKSFNQHINKDREKIKEDLNEKKDEKLVEDLTDLVWAAAAGAGLYGLGKVWDKWGKDMAASLPFRGVVRDLLKKYMDLYYRV